MTRLILGGGTALLAAGVLLGSAPAARAVVKASDNAGDPAYAAEVDGAWKGVGPSPDENPAGMDNGGTGFEPWSFAGGYNLEVVPPSPYGILNHFIDGVDFPTTQYNDLGAPAFGLGNSPGGYSGFTTTATRPFTAPMVVGDVFSADIDTPAAYDDYTEFNFPFAIIAFQDANGEQTFEFEAGSSVIYGDFNWRYKDGVHTADFGDFGVDAGGASIPPTATSDGSSIRLEVLSPTTGRVTLDGVSLNITFAAGLPAAVTFVLFDNNAEAPLVGDFNENFVIDGADLTQWKGDFGVDDGSNADGDADTDGNDFLLWQRNIGAVSGTPTGEHAFYFDNLQIESSAAVVASGALPEPTALALASAAGLALVAGRRRALRGSSTF